MALAAARYTISLSSYWRFLLKRGEAHENPWQGQSLPKEHRHPDDKERPFTDEEVKRLLEGTPPGRLGAIIRIAALSGARIDAIVSLKAKDCQVSDGEGLFRFKPQKNERAHRFVPIHSELVGLVEELIRGKNPEEDVFPEYPEPRPGIQQERSSPAVKVFTRYRRAVGVDETRPGRKRALTNFHSFRRWFITRAEQAGQPENVIASVVGHQRLGMTFGVYSRGPSMEQLRACVEAVRLPGERRKPIG
jgi:integrase